VRTARCAGVCHWHIVSTAQSEAQGVDRWSSERSRIRKGWPLPGEGEKQNPSDQPSMH
jgi:hypothetical protein